MSKMPIAWHREALKNSISSLHRKKVELSAVQQRLQTEILEDSERISFYTDQIDVAEERGMDGFDSDRFMKKERIRRRLP